MNFANLMYRVLFNKIGGHKPVIRVLICSEGNNFQKSPFSEKGFSFMAKIHLRKIFFAIDCKKKNFIYFRCVDTFL